MRTLLIILLLVSAVPVQAATLLLTGERYPEGEVRVAVNIAPSSQSINAIEGTLVLPEGVTGYGISIGGSVVSNWVEVPVIENGVIRFAGIMPGGFSGTAVPGAGFTGEGTVLSFMLPAAAGEVRLVDAAVYINDGAGTRVSVDAATLSLAEAVVVQEKGPQDTTPPEYLDVTGMRDEGVADGAYALIMESFDAETGIAYFEVKEFGGAWVRAQTPYVVNDTWGVMPLTVRVYDYAGNFRETMVPGARDWVLVVGYALLTLVLAAALISLLVYLRKRS